MVKIKCSIFIALLIILLSNCSPYPSYTASFSGVNDQALLSNRYTTIDGSRVFYSESQEYSNGFLIGGYSDSNRQNINGIGTIKVMVKMGSENNLEEFGIKYGEDSDPMNEINFYIKQNGTYTVYWFDNTTFGSNISWYFSSNIKTGLNEWNELCIDYNTTQKTFSFYINNSPRLLEKTFNSIGAGRVSYYTSLRNANTTFPYKIEFRTISPNIYP